MLSLFPREVGHYFLHPHSRKHITPQPAGTSELESQRSFPVRDHHYCFHLPKTTLRKATDLLRLWYKLRGQAQPVETHTPACLPAWGCPWGRSVTICLWFCKMQLLPSNRCFLAKTTIKMKLLFKMGPLHSGKIKPLAGAPGSYRIELSINFI